MPGTTQPRVEDREVVVVGGGFSGIGAGARLAMEGVDDVVILERSGGVGGTWRENRYPGAACDIRSHLYSFSFAPNPDWTRSYSPQEEIEAYLDRCLDRFGLRDRFRSGEEVLQARWDDDGGRWEVTTPDRCWRAPVLVWATGPLSEPRVPELPGLSKFHGTVFHSAAWRHDVDLRGRRVAVVGTGASAIQFVPRIQPLVEHLVVHQRTPAWVVPRRDHAIPEWRRALYRRVPAAQTAVRAGIYVQQEMLVPMVLGSPRARRIFESAARKHLAGQVADPELRDALTPDFAIGCKRVLVSDDYYPALTRPNVELVTEAAAELREDAVVDSTGRSRPVDTVIFATGFNASEPSFPQRITGRGGRCLADDWREGMEAHLGTLVHGYPNLLLMLGPNTVLGHNSVVFMLEAQLQLLVHLMRLRRSGVRSVEVRQRAQRAYNAELQRKLSTTVWSTGGCASWYLDHRGRNTTLWPGYTLPYRRRTRRIRAADVVARPLPGLGRPADGGPANGAEAAEWGNGERSRRPLRPGQISSGSIGSRPSGQGMPPSTRSTAPVV